MESPSKLNCTPSEDRKILLALFHPQTEHADGCLFKTSGLCCQCGFPETVGNYRWALRRATEIATEHYGKAFKAQGPADEDVGYTRADGWAIIECVGIDVRSVSPTRRAAIVNWLVTRKGLFVTTSWDDDRIDKAWDALRGEADAFEVIVCTK